MDKRVALGPKKIHDENAIKTSTNGIKRPSSVIAGKKPSKVNPQKRVVLGSVTTNQRHNATTASKSMASNKMSVYNDTKQPPQSYYDGHAGSDDTELEEEEDDDEDDNNIIEEENDDSEDADGVKNTNSTNPNALSPRKDHDLQLEFKTICKKVQPSLEKNLQDDEDIYDVSMVTEYSDEIFHYMQQLEGKMKPDACYMDKQNEIHWSMRSILIDWLVQVHHRFNLLPETLFLTINYIDRFLTIKVVSLSKFQLVGAVALFLAAKYEEINCPSVQEIAYMVDHGYTVDEILKAERYMIDMLNFNLGWPGPMSFLRRTSKADDYDLETRTLAKYLLEVTIMDKKFVSAPPSWTAAAAHCLARRMLQRGVWTNYHVYFSGYTYTQLEPCVNAILECCQDPQTHHKAIYEKYTDRRFKRASLFVKNWMENEYQKFSS